MYKTHRKKANFTFVNLKTLRRLPSEHSAFHMQNLDVNEQLYQPRQRGREYRLMLGAPGYQDFMERHKIGPLW